MHTMPKVSGITDTVCKTVMVHGPAVSNIPGGAKELEIISVEGFNELCTYILNPLTDYDET
jgi:hypothetical protein